MKRTHTLLFGLLLAQATACLSDDQLVDETSETTDEVGTTVGIERIVPIHYYVLDGFWSPCAVTAQDSAIHDGVRQANRLWQKAGIQFSVSMITRTTGAPDFLYLNYTQVPYSSVWPQLRAIDAGLTASSFPAGEMHSNDEWLTVIQGRLTHREIALVVPCTDIAPFAGHAAFPSNPLAYGVHIAAPFVGSEVLGHELGHYFGLIHTMDATDSNAYDELFGISPTGTATFFRSAAEVNAFRAGWGNRVTKKNGTYSDLGWIPGDQQFCSYVNSTTCEMQCEFGNRVYRTSTDPDAMTGMSQGVTGATRPYTTNVMSYLRCNTGDGTVAPLDLMPSQVERIHAALRSSVGDRNLLGRGSTRLGPARFSTLDFDGDRRRDLAFFRPETSECVVRYWADGGQRWLTIPGGDPAQGDQPMPGDYDGDGKTDCAVFRPGTATTNARFLWTASGSGYAAHNEEWGEAGDIPIANINLPASPGYGHYAIFRPSTGDVWWRTSPTTWSSVWMGASSGDEIVFGDYDHDGKTDLAFWQPQISDASSQARLRISFSATGFTSYRSWNFGLEGDLPIGPVRRDYGYELDFAVWRPSNGVWYYLLNPRNDGSSGYMEQQWGTYGDVPIQGYDFDLDGRDDEVVWRASGAGTTLYVHRSTTGGYYALPIGNPGDVPFFAPDANYDGVPELYLFRPTGAPTGRHFEMNSSGLSYPSVRTIATSMRFTDIEL